MSQAGLRLPRAAFALITSLVFSYPLWAQTGSLSGTVRDASQSPVGNATVSLSSPSTGFTRSAQTNEAGLYTFTYLQPGVYNLQATSAGLAPQSREGVHLDVAQTVRIDFELQVGSTQQKIEVSASQDLIQPETSSLGQVINERSVNELPLNGRNPLALVALVPGVVPQGQSQQNAAGTNNSAYGNFQIGGGTANQSAFILDGISLVVPFGHAVELIPSQELIQEFKVQTNNLPPELGEFSGGVVNLTTKGGTNTLHGEGYEFLRNKVLNSNNFFNNRSGVPTGAFTQNQFGGTLGGPVVIPKLYNGHDKTFFFGNYEGFRLRQGQPLLLSVPTQAERNGDFRGLSDSSGNTLNVYNPFSSTVANTPRQQVQCNGAANVICPSQINPVSAKLLSLWALPNIPGAQNSSVNNWAGNASSGGNTDQGTMRIDHYVSEKQRLFLRYTYWKDNDLAVDPFQNGTYAGGIGTPEWYSTHHIVLDDTYTFSPTTIADFRVGVMRFSYMRSPQTAGLDLTTIGWPSFLNDQIQASVRTLPNICISEFSEFCGGNTGSVLDSWDTNYEADPSLTTVQGKHTLKFGMQFRVSRQNYIQTNNGTGGYNFTPAYTSAVPLQTGGGGNGFASFLFGAVQNGSVQEPAPTASQLIYSAYYMGDTYKVTDKLTLNLGLRYEITNPWTERYNRISYWDQNAINPVGATAGLGTFGAVGLVSTPAHPWRSAMSTNYNQLSPRVGLAYQLTPKTVIRTGYGIVWLPIDVNLDSAPDHDVINAITDNMITSNNGGVSPYNLLSNPFPNGITQPPQRSANYQQYLYGQNILTQSPDNLLGYTQQWNFDVQRQLTGNSLLDVAYAGAKGTHLPLQTYDSNFLTIQQLSLGTALTQSVTNPFYGKVPSTSPLSTPTVPASQLLLPYPQYGNVQYASQGMGDSSYNSLQAKFESRFGAGGTLLAAYTFSKLIGNSESLTPWLESNWNAGFQYWGNLKAERSLATFDVPQRFVTSYVLDLPVGHGRKYLSNVHGVTSALVSGWGINGILTLQRGTPLFLGTANNLTGNTDGGSRPNYDKAACPSGAGTSGSRESRLNDWFNPNCFTQPAPFTYGNVGRTLNLRTDGIRNLDFALFKKTAFGPEGRVVWEFRAEAFNLLNTPQFGYPNMTTGLPGQTGVVSSQANNPRLIQFGTKLSF